MNTKGFTPISTTHISKQDLCSYAYFTILHVTLQHKIPTVHRTNQ